MKKIKILVALLAVIFAVGSAFTTKAPSLVDDGFYANKDRNPSTEQDAGLDDQSEADINSEVSTTLSAWASLHCTDPTTRTCAVEIVNDQVVQRIPGSYIP